MTALLEYLDLPAPVSLLRLYYNIIVRIHVKLLIPGITPGIILRIIGEEKKLLERIIGNFKSIMCVSRQHLAKALAIFAHG